jgi:hypothetical protein
MGGGQPILFDVETFIFLPTLVYDPNPLHDKSSMTGAQNN